MDRQKYKSDAWFSECYLIHVCLVEWGVSNMVEYMYIFHEHCRKQKKITIANKKGNPLPSGESLALNQKQTNPWAPDSSNGYKAVVLVPGVK